MWVVFKTGDNGVVKEKMVARPYHTFRFMAQSNANALNRDPEILAKSLEVLMRTGRGLWVDCEVRRVR